MRKVMRCTVFLCAVVTGIPKGIAYLFHDFVSAISAPASNSRNGAGEFMRASA